MVSIMVRAADDRSFEPAGFLSCRLHGDLEAITDSERRALRSIGMTAREAAGRTSALLAELLAVPGVRIFQGIRPPARGQPRIPHAITAGHQLVLAESVAWPPGRYSTGQAGRILCDGTYIGQSVRPLMAAIRQWRETLPAGHRVTAVVVVHPAADGDLALPPAAGRDLAWARPGDAVRQIRSRLPRQPQPASMKAVAALLTATAADSGRASGMNA